MKAATKAHSGDHPPDINGKPAEWVDAKLVQDAMGFQDDEISTCIGGNNPAVYACSYVLSAEHGGYIFFNGSQVQVRGGCICSWPVGIINDAMTRGAIRPDVAVIHGKKWRTAGQ